MRVEYRVCWSASSNISFKGQTDWVEWDDDEATSEDVELALCDGGALCDGLEAAIAGSGFGWTVETREVEEAGQS